MLLNHPLCSALILVFCLLVVCAGVVEPVEDTHDTVGPAPPSFGDLVRVGEYTKAHQRLESDPGLRSSQTLAVARLLRETGNLDAAISLLEESAPFRAETPGYRVAVAGIYAFLGNIEVAKKHLRAVLEKNPGHPEARARLGILLCDSGERNAGSAHLKKLVEKAKETSGYAPETLVWLGRAAMAINEYHLANDVFLNQALRIDPDCVEAHLALGELFHSKYDYPHARECYRRALAVNPNRVEAHVGIAKATWHDPAGAGKDAHDALRKIKYWKTHPAASQLTGRMELARDHFEEAERHFLAAVRVNPWDLESQGNLAAFYKLSRQEQDFDRVVAAVEERHPSPAEFYTVLAERIGRYWRVEDADHYAERALAVDADYWPAYMVRGLYAFRTGKDRVGRKWMERAFEADPFNVWAYNFNVLTRHMDREFVVDEAEDFTVRLSRDDAPFMLERTRTLLVATKSRMEKQFGIKIPHVSVEGFSDRARYAARSTGLPTHHSRGMCFGRQITFLTPEASGGNWGAVVVHELAHTATAVRSDYRVSRWLTEGIAEHAEGHFRKHWEDWYLEEFVDGVTGGRLRPIKKLDFAFGRRDEIHFAYAQSRAIVVYIEHRWGFDKVLELLDCYREGVDEEDAFMRAFSMSTPQFDHEFRLFAEGVVAKWGLGCRYKSSQIPKLRATADRSQSADDWVRVGMAYFFDDKYISAQFAVDRARTKQPDHPDLVALEGFLAYHHGQKKEARKKLTRALGSGTSYAYRSARVLGYLLYKGERYEEAAAVLRTAVRKYPGCLRGCLDVPHPYSVLHQIYTSQDDHDAAARMLRKFARYDRNKVGARLLLADHYIEKGDWSEVVEVLADAVYVDPFHYDTHEVLANAYVQTDAYGDAIRHLKLLLRFDKAPRAMVHSQLAWCYQQLEDAARAKEHAQYALDIDPDAELAKDVLRSSAQETD